ncbi:LTP_2 domain-containing protein [Cephalotus follicularis]|uniref:LTP_2 domain-containing protein n=1 Tax=Cephalotus follicularis TaxID=3775 RepID=A0A1Q3DBV5_CEPFO|nr:LTP_2 domain-containing protein [Cephalotus follicularis]
MITALTFLLTTAIFLTSVSQPPPPPPQSSCVEELVSLSPCLGYISAPPNNINQDVTPQCCHAFSSTDGDCLCYLLRQPLIFGFPLNESRVLSLSSVCDSSTRNGSFARSGSLDSFCSGFRFSIV